MNTHTQKKREINLPFYFLHFVILDFLIKKKIFRIFTNINKSVNKLSTKKERERCRMELTFQLSL